MIIQKGGGETGIKQIELAKFWISFKLLTIPILWFIQISGETTGLFCPTSIEKMIWFGADMLNEVRNKKVYKDGIIGRGKHFR